MELKELEAEIRKLDVKERAELAKRIMAGLDDLSEEEIEALWADEAERRLDDMERGLVPEIPAEEVLGQARAALT
ncbi:MAG: addiction module protein [Thermodesulfobacteriota bacterium]